MATIEENINRWQTYDWKDRGDEWSEVWGGTPYLWHGTLYPRLLRFLPANHILEIAPGFGRFTHYLKDHCQTLEIVDLTERCIAACRERFRAADHILYHVNDGRSLAMVADRSVDFVFSFDSLVHAEAEVLAAYLQQLSAKLRPGGVGFIHHSNLASLKDEQGRLPFTNRHWRAESMSAALFGDFCQAAGLEVISQELINWGLEQMTDCLSVFALRGSPWGPPRGQHPNPDFMNEAVSLGRIGRLYS